ncbi:MAG TPA: flagellar motor switch protein FliN [Opitutae bacterium]|nr:flagellar motor switch protein FliN [Opitutae bacterium]|tara:strand:+ start:6861 stop:7169 length:309 start_codon:yes stop_codon:yes gene_type:complete
MSETSQEPKNLDLIWDMNVSVTVQLGSCEIPMREIVALEPGAVVQLEQHAKDPVRLYVNKKLAAFGEVVVVEDNFGIKITELVGAQEAPVQAKEAVEAKTES